ncbi:MAG: hypothetical protein ACN2B6_08265 [Rickettsiales bacterium]
MTFDVTQVGTLLGGSLKPPSSKVSDLITGVNQDVTTSLFGGVTQSTTSLTSVQSGAISNLQNFVLDNVGEADQGKLLSSIAALESFLKIGNAEGTSSLDPVFSLLAANPDAAGKLPSGSLVDQLL